LAKNAENKCPNIDPRSKELRHVTKVSVVEAFDPLLFSDDEDDGKLARWSLCKLSFSFNNQTGVEFDPLISLLCE
jgi:hypothetical protein